MKIISGGQTGADQGALEAAKALGIETGGMMPKGWITQEGPRPDFAELYNMIEAPQKGYPYRTFWNVQNSDATIKFAVDFESAGEICTDNAIAKYKKPWLNVRLLKDNNLVPSRDSIAYVTRWLKENKVETLNVAGNSNKTHYLMQTKVRLFIGVLLSGL